MWIHLSAPFSADPLQHIRIRRRQHCPHRSVHKRHCGHTPKMHKLARSAQWTRITGRCAVYRSPHFLRSRVEIPQLRTQTITRRSSLPSLSGLGQAGGYGFDARCMDAYAVLADRTLSPGPRTSSHSRSHSNSYGHGHLGKRLAPYTMYDPRAARVFVGAVFCAVQARAEEEGRPRLRECIFDGQRCDVRECPSEKRVEISDVYRTGDREPARVARTHWHGRRAARGFRLRPRRAIETR